MVLQSNGCGVIEREARLELITCESVVVGLVETLVVVMVLDSNGYGERD
jgi:hypothetical protein